MARTIDIHQHMWDPTWQPEAHKMGAAIRAATRKPPFRDPNRIRPRVGVGYMDPTGGLNIKVLDRIGIDMGVVQVVDWSLGYGEEAEASIDAINEGTSRGVANHPDRLLWFCGIDPRRPGAADKFERWVKQFGAKGFKLYPPMGYYPTDDCCEPIFRKAIELNVPILSHSQAGLKWAEPIHWNDVCRKFPDLQVILGHAGLEAPFWTSHGWEQAVIVASRNRNLYLDPTEWHLWGALKNVGDLVKRLGIMRDTCGAHRIVFGTDNPIGKDGGDSGDGEWTFIWKNLPTIGRWFGAEFTQDEVDMMLGGNAERLLGLAPAFTIPTEK